VVWGKSAENCAKYLGKGKGVHVSGKLRTRSWDDNNSGQKKYSTEIVAKEVVFLPAGNTNQSGNRPPQAQGQPQGQPQGQQQRNQSSNRATTQGARSFDTPNPSDLDQIPF